MGIVSDLSNEFSSFKKRIPPSWLRAYEIFLSIMAINFVLFFIGSFILGGDAINGHIEDGKYYLRMKEQLTEVSESVFMYSKYHSLSVIWSFSLALGIPGIFIVGKVVLSRFLIKKT